MAFELDAALYNRFDLTLEVGPMPVVEEVKVVTKRTNVDDQDAGRIVKVANILRQNKIQCSTRTSLLVGCMVKAGLSIREAYETAVVKRVQQDEGAGGQRKQVVDLLNTELGPFALRKLSKDIFSPNAVEPVVLPVEPEVPRVVGVAILKAKPETGLTLGQVTIIQALRQLSTVSDSGSEMSFKEAS